jgi:anti-sigma-K factor RskA
VRLLLGSAPLSLRCPNQRPFRITISTRRAVASVSLAGGEAAPPTPHVHCSSRSAAARRSSEAACFSAARNFLESASCCRSAVMVAACSATVASALGGTPHTVSSWSRAYEMVQLVGPPLR